MTSIALEPKSPATTSLMFSVRVTPLECDENQRMYGGELTKLLDVAGTFPARFPSISHNFTRCAVLATGTDWRTAAPHSTHRNAKLTELVPQPES